MVFGDVRRWNEGWECRYFEGGFFGGIVGHGVGLGWVGSW